MAMVQEVYKRMGCPNWQPNLEYKIPALGHCSDCVKRYNEELVKLTLEVNQCHICGVAWPETGSSIFRNPSWYSPEVLNEVFRRLTGSEYRANPYCNPVLEKVPATVICQNCLEKFDAEEAKVIKESHT